MKISTHKLPKTNQNATALEKIEQKLIFHVFKSKTKNLTNKIIRNFMTKLKKQTQHQAKIICKNIRKNAIQTSRKIKMRIMTKF